MPLVQVCKLVCCEMCLSWIGLSFPLGLVCKPFHLLSFDSLILLLNRVYKHDTIGLSELLHKASLPEVVHNETDSKRCG